MSAPLLEVRRLRKDFAIRSGLFRRGSGKVAAVAGVDFDLAAGETLGLVGESGSGKSTTARLVMRLIEPTAGSIRFDGTEIADSDERDVRRMRSRMQMIFQDPFASLDPRMAVGDTVAEPLVVHGDEGRVAREERVREVLGLVGIGGDVVGRHPHEFSGGQRQRIAIARAMVTEPDLIVCDEPVSALDVSTQSQVINLLVDLQERFGMAYLFISHDLSIVRHVSHRAAVMYLGRLVETGPTEEVHDRPRHPYTKALLSAIPVPAPRTQARRERIVLDGDPPSPIDPPAGCRFHPRCPQVMDVCHTVDPAPRHVEGGVLVACHLYPPDPGSGTSVEIGDRTD